MFSHKRQLPVLQSRSCVFSDYNAAWIADTLQDAADCAGIPLPFKDEITRSVMLYLEEYYPLSAMPLDYLFGRMRAMLREVGLVKLADHLAARTPAVDISLPELAANAPLPLQFFPSLKEEVAKWHDIGVNACAFTGRRECALILSGKKRWSIRSREMLEELDGFIEELPTA